MKKILRNILQYVVVLFVSLSIALLLRLFVVDFYTIPSDSMQPTIEPGDFILVDKLSFGARLYKNLDFLKNDTTPQTWRMKGFSPIRNGDVVVFNFPYAESWDRIRMHLSCFFVKRCIAIPGDTLQIKQGFYMVNGQQGFGNLYDQQTLSRYPDDFTPGIYHTFPFDARIGWNILRFGPLYLPRKGDTLPIDTLSYRIYQKMIRYESNLSLEERNGQIWSGDSLIEQYTFHRNWYFMGGDNIWNSQDSRYLGPIPEEFIIGKAILILTAKDPETRQYRWKRFFTRIRKEVRSPFE